MAKIKTQYVCNDCGASSPKWAGKCPSCGAWNSLHETTAASSALGGSDGNRYSWTGSKARIVPLKDAQTVNFTRFSTGLSEMDRVLGGGAVEGSVVLLGGDPGVGKSTLLLQLLHFISEKGKTLYVTGEESAGQTQMRAKRLGIPIDTDIDIAPASNLEQILEFIQETAAKFVVIDSIQTIFSGQLQSAPGTVAQVRECAAQLTQMAKTTGVTLFLVGHVTKEGTLAGPRVLEHIVDTVLYFEGEEGSSFRMIRAWKNRFGCVNELGVFSMEENGLQDVSNPSSMFLTSHERPMAGSCVTVALEGNRPFLVEIQALVEHTNTPNPKRAATGIEVNRVNLMLAILSRHMGVDASDKNVYVKVVGGIKLTEPAADLALLVALYSSLKNKPVPQGLAVFGEAGLVGEVRNVSNAESRVKEAARLGFKNVIKPSKSEIKKTPKDIRVHDLKLVTELPKIFSDI